MRCGWFIPSSRINIQKFKAKKLSRNNQFSGYKKVNLALDEDKMIENNNN